MVTLDPDFYLACQYKLEIMAAINFYRQLAQKGTLIRLPIDDEKLSQIPTIILRQVLYKLQSDDEAIIIKFQDYESAFPTLSPDHPLNLASDVYRVVFLEVTDNFDAIRAIYKESFLLVKDQITEPTERRCIKPMTTEAAQIARKSLAADSEIAFRLTFDKTSREFKINGQKIMRTPQFGSVNYMIALELFENPNTMLKRKDLIAKYPEISDKSFQKWAEDLEMPPNIKKAFFNMSKTEIIFYPQKTYQELKTMDALPLWEGQQLPKWADLFTN